MLPPNEQEKRRIRDLVFGKTDGAYRGTALDAYMEHYNSVIRPYADSPNDVIIDIGAPALQTHADLLECVSSLQNGSKDTFNDFTVTLRPLSGAVRDGDRQNIINTVVKILFMVDCKSRFYRSSEVHGISLSHTRWEGNTRFCDFLTGIFQDQGIRQLRAQEQSSPPPSSYPDFNHRKTLKAWKLIGRYNIEIKPTSNLLEHLLYDSSTRSLKVFHHVSFLKAQLRRTRDESLGLGFEESLERGGLPPRLVLETLMTIHHILFPVVEDSRSYFLLKEMVKKKGFDRDCKYVDFIRSDFDQPNMAYEYWGGRLENLYKLVKNPPPANAMVAWFERHTSERNALTVAILGLFLAALFGFFSVIIGIFQLVIAWLAWKYPQV